MCIQCNVPDSKVHGVNMGPIWGWQDPGGSHVAPMNIAVWGVHINLNLRFPDEHDVDS